MSNKMWNNIKQAYENHEEKVSLDLWEQLESRLDENKSEEISQKETRKPGFGWFKYAAVFLIFLTLGGILFYNSNQEAEQNQLVEVEKNPMESNDNSTEKTSNHPSENTENQLNVGLESPSVKIINIEAQKLKPIESQLNSIQQKKSERITTTNSIQNIGKPQNILAQKPTLNEEVQQEIPQIAEQKITHIEPEKKSIAKTTTSYVKADELLFSREYENQKKLEKKKPLKTFVHNLNKNEKPLFSSITVLGITVFSDDLN